MPTIMPADALIRAADNLTDAITGIVPPPNMTTDAINQLITIFKSHAEKAKDAATAQRVLQGRAQAQRVLTEANHQEDIKVPTTEHIRNTPFISQDDHLDTSTPAARQWQV